MANYPNLNSSLTDQINVLYPLMPPLPEHNAYFPSASAAYGESTFTCPGNIVSGALSKVWNYRYNVTSLSNIAAGLGTTHTFELPAILGPGNAGDSVSASGYNAQIVPVVMDYWISFVESLNPNTFRSGDSPVWEGFGSGGEQNGRRLLLETNGTVMETVPRDQVERCGFWRSLVGVLEQ